MVASVAGAGGGGDLGTADEPCGTENVVVLSGAARPNGEVAVDRRVEGRGEVAMLSWVT